MAKEWSIKPAMHRILIQVIPQEDAIYGEKPQIILPGGRPEETFSKLYRVVAVGDGEVSTRYAVGDIIFVLSYAGGLIKHKGEEFFAIGEGEVSAKLDIHTLELPVN